MKTKTPRIPGDEHLKIEWLIDRLKEANASRDSWQRMATASDSHVNAMEALVTQLQSQLRASVDLTLLLNRVTYLLRRWERDDPSKRRRGRRKK